MLIGREKCLVRGARNWTFWASVVEGTVVVVLGRPNTNVDLWTSGPVEVWIPLGLSGLSVLSVPGWTSSTSPRMCEEGITEEYLLYTLAL